MRSFLMVLSLLAAGSAQAEVWSHGRAESTVQLANGSPQIVADPHDRWLRRVDGFSVEASVNNFISYTGPSGNPVAATGNASFAFEAGTVRTELLTAADDGQPGPGDGATAYTIVGGYITISGTITGTPGTKGLLSLSGSFAAAVAAGAQGEWQSLAEVGFGVGMQISRPGQAGCPYAKCLAQDGLNGRFENGAYPVDFGKSFLITLEGTVGDRFDISFNVGAQASNGYYVLIGPAPGVPAGQQMALGADGGFAGIGGLTLTKGLGLSADSGLVQRGDGSWGAPVSVVPEAPAWALMSLGLLALLGRRRARV
jgi:hypothetical protein